MTVAKLLYINISATFSIYDDPLNKKLQIFFYSLVGILVRKAKLASSDPYFSHSWYSDTAGMAAAFLGIWIYEYRDHHDIKHCKLLFPYCPLYFMRGELH